LADMVLHQPPIAATRLDGEVAPQIPVLRVSFPSGIEHDTAEILPAIGVSEPVITGRPGPHIPLVVDHLYEEVLIEFLEVLEVDADQDVALEQRVAHLLVDLCLAGLVDHGVLLVEQLEELDGVSCSVWSGSPTRGSPGIVELAI